MTPSCRKLAVESNAAGLYNRCTCDRYNNDIILYYIHTPSYRRQNARASITNIPNNIIVRYVLSFIFFFPRTDENDYSTYNYYHHQLDAHCCAFPPPIKYYVSLCSLRYCYNNIIILLSVPSTTACALLYTHIIITLYYNAGHIVSV